MKGIINKILVGEDYTSERKHKEFIYRELKKIPADKKILDAGAGEMKFRPACSHLKYTSQDFCQYKGKGNNVGLQTGTWDTKKIDIVSDIIDIPVEKGAFDAILCSEVLEHLPFPEKAIQEFGRILEKDGVLILTAPFCSLTHFAPYHYCTGFNKYWYEKHLTDNGFEIISIERNGDFYSYLRQEIMRLTSVQLKYSKKKSLWISLYSKLLIFSMRKIINTENESGELLCLGYHVVAKKK